MGHLMRIMLYTHPPIHPLLCYADALLFVQSRSLVGCPRGCSSRMPAWNVPFSPPLPPTHPLLHIISQ